MTDQQRKALLSLYEDLRVCDARDGMDALGYFHYGTVDAAIRPLWRTRAVGIARTVRYLPYVGPTPNLSPREYRDEWSSMYYSEICKYPWEKEIEAGDFVVIDQSSMKVGLMGSENTLARMNQGARGFITNGGVRDTDEIILQKVPFWSAGIAQSMVQVRLQFDAMNIPVAIGGVTIRPGDMVVADGDGVISVPQEIAEDVARFAHEEHDADKERRRGHYQAAGMQLDETVS